MSDSGSEENDFVFKNNQDFDQAQEKIQAQISNEQNLKKLGNICKSFYNNLQDNDFFGEKFSWKTYSEIEPIKLKISSTESSTEMSHGICNIIKPNGKLYHKILLALSSIILEVDNLLPDNGDSIYQSLGGLSIYGEEVDDNLDESKIYPDIQISRMLSYLNEIKVKIDKLLTIGTNLFNQLLCIYGGEKQNKNYSTSYKNFTFSYAFEYLGKILSYFLAVDTVFSNNENLFSHWEIFRKTIYHCKMKSEYNMSEEQKKKLTNLQNHINSRIFQGTCYSQCLKIIYEKFSKAKDDRLPKFLKHFTSYLYERIKIIQASISSDSHNPIEIFQFISLFGLYQDMVGKKVESSLAKSVWGIQKKVWLIPIVGITDFEIFSFLRKRHPFKDKISYEPTNLKNCVQNEINNIKKNLAALINNYNIKVMRWTVKIEERFLNHKIFEKPNTNVNTLNENNGQKAQFILYGIRTAKYLRNLISTIIKSCIKYELGISIEVIISITSGLELIKVIQAELNKLLPMISIHVNIMNKALTNPLQDMIKKAGGIIETRYKETKTPVQQLYEDAYSAAKKFFDCIQAVQSRLRIVIERLCLNTLAYTIKPVFDEATVNRISGELEKIEIINQLSREIEKSCDCSFLYSSQVILETCYKSIYSDRPKRLYYFIMALNDIEKPLYNIKHKEKNGIELIKKFRENIYKEFESTFLMRVAQDIEENLNIQIHGEFIQGFNSAPYSDINLNNYLNIKNFRFFDKIICIRRYVEEYLNQKFYKLTVPDLSRVKTYQRMRVLGSHKFNLNFVDIILPEKSIENGKDILEVVRTLQTFSKTYTHNLNSQIFLEKINKNINISSFGIQQIINSLNIHGTGIINSILNKAYQVISKYVMNLFNKVLGDDYIVSIIRDECIYWEKEKAKIQYKYPLEKAKKARSKILSLDENKKTNSIDIIIQLITQIGNIVGLVRMIKTAVKEYNSKNVNILTCHDVNRFNDLSNQIDLEPKEESSNISPNTITNIKNALYDANKIFCDSINSLKQIGINESNYLEILVKAFGDNLTSEKVPKIKNFPFLIPPLTLSFSDNCINARDNILKLNKANKSEENAYIFDDGFILGICYLLKVCNLDKDFDNLSWFESVINDFKNQKGNKSQKDVGVDTLNDRQISSYLEQYELQYYTYTSASVLFYK